MPRNSHFLCVIVAVVLSLVGCEKRQERQQATFNTSTDTEYVLTVIVDLSGSFADLMAEQGRAYTFLLEVVNRYFRDRIGTNDRLVLAQISANEHALLWEGTPIQLRREFATPEAFRDLLRAKGDPSGSRVHDAITNAIEYVTANPGVASGRAKSAIFVLSDMLENSPDPKESEERLTRALSNYRGCGGLVGVYYCDQLQVPVWRARLQKAGIKEYCVESEIVGKPTLPSFE